MTYQVFNLPPQQPLSAAGRVLPGAKAYFYLTGTDTPVNVWTTSALSVAHAVPVVADAGGRFSSIFLDPTVTYKLTVTDSSDVLLYTVDPCNDVVLSQAIIGEYLYPLDDAEDSEEVTNYAYPPGHAFRYGTAGDGVTDDTQSLLNMFDTWIPAAKRVTIPGGTYLVSGPISTVTSIDAGGLHIHCEGDVTIQVSGGASSFNTLLKCHTAAINNATLTGGRLTIDLNSKCASGIYIRHGGGDGGFVDLGPLTVLNAMNNDDEDEDENQAVFVYGRYTYVNMIATHVDGVDRTNPDAGVCKGISISDIVGAVSIVSPQVSRVLCSSSSPANDADGIAVFAHQGAGVYHARPGFVSIVSPIITDCQGRMIKLQMSESVIVNPVLRRKSVQNTDVQVDIDYQIGGTHELISPSFEYLLDGMDAPVTDEHIPVGFQQRSPDRPNSLRISGGTMRTETLLRNFVFVTVDTDALAGEVRVEDFTTQNVGALATNAYDRAFVEFDAAQVQAGGGTHIAIHNCRGNFSGAALLGYAPGAANTNQLSFELIGNTNTGADNSSSYCFTQLSGTAITTVANFNLHGNSGFLDHLFDWVFDYRTLRVGCTFTYSRTGATASNGPTISAGTRVRAHCVGADTIDRRACWAIVDDANAADTLFYTSTGTWGTIK